MDCDRISTLPDPILCYILSFLPTKESVATSILSKRWNPLWSSVPTFHFDLHHKIHFVENNKETYSRFVHSVYSFLLWRDFDQPLHTFHLRCCSIFYDPIIINTWVNAAIRGSVQHLDLYLVCSINIPSSVLSSKTLVVLKLTRLSVEDLSFVDLPSLKVLHLKNVFFSKGLDLSQFLSGTPNLEDLEAKNLVVRSNGEFKRLVKLVRANIHHHLVPLEVVNNVEFLCIDWIYAKDPIPKFLNLTHLELELLRLKKDWHDVLEVLKGFPKLQTLVIVIEKMSFEFELLANNGHEEVWSYPESVPVCISFHLKTCCLRNYRGSNEDEFQFAKYIMENARHLRTMKICSYNDANQEERQEMMKDLSSCTRSSGTCILSFE